MGQYHILVNLDKREYLHPHKLGDGLKLREQVNSEGGIMAALWILLAASNGRGGGDLCPGGHELIGAWAGDRIALVGDYAEPYDLPSEHRAELLYGAVHHGDEDEYSEDCGVCKGEIKPLRDISELLIPLIEENCGFQIYGTGWRNKREVGWRAAS